MTARCAMPFCAHVPFARNSRGSSFITFRRVDACLFEQHARLSAFTYHCEHCRARARNIARRFSFLVTSPAAAAPQRISTITRNASPARQRRNAYRCALSLRRNAWLLADQH